ncbi:MAG: hypothetical protein K2Q10_02360, partial [Rhodospirillales bacterium]|nr:hypothetical protein [Rhodospirillales bacterium]
MLDNLTISKKLWLLSGVFMLPVLLLTWLLVAQAGKDIDFAAKELDGSAYIGALRGVAVGLSSIHQEGGGESVRRGLSSLEAMERRYGAAMGSAEQAKAVVQAIKVFLAGDPTADTPQAEAVAKLHELISRIGDNSNLILDPDLDSYYAMDLVVVKMPELLERMDAIADLLYADLKAGSVGAEQKAAYLIAKGALSSIIESVDGDIAAGYRGNSDGSLKEHLDPPHKRLSATLAAFTRALDAGAAKVGGGQGQA